MKNNVQSIKKQIIFFGFLLFALTTNAQVVINEYSCANLKSFPDNFAKHGDWIELYNAGDAEVNVAGYYLSDNLSKPQKWEIPDATGSTIPAKGFMIFWATKRDTAIDGHFHTNFTLKQTKKKKETIVLSNTAGEKIDEIKISIHQVEHSMGRTTDGAATWSVFKEPTLKASNNESTPYSYAPRAVLSKVAGFYSSQVTVEISGAEQNQEIRYTLDGSFPEATSSLYSDAINITSTTVLKARIFSSENDVLPGLMQYATYFIDVSHTLPVISVTGNQMLDLVNDITPLVRPTGTFEYFQNDTLSTRAAGEYNKHGQDSWVCDQRSIDFISRDEMGDNHSLKGKLFHISDRKKFQRIILRASGDDNYPCGHNPSNNGSAHMRDGFIQNLVKRDGLHLDVRLSERNVVYINGQYWGVYEIRENVDDHDYTKYYYKQSRYDLQYILTWGRTWVGYGGEKAYSDWKECYNFIIDNDMTVQTNYDSVKSMFNVKSFVDYILVNSFTVCTDWLNYNVAWWRGLNPKGNHKKWGYTLWDNDATFAFYINYTGLSDTSANALPCNPEGLDNSYSDPEGHIKMLNKLNENEEFHQYYVGRQADLLNTTFGSENMLGYFDEYMAIIEPEMAQHAIRWNGTYDEWKANAARLRNFIVRRTTALETGISSCYDLSGPYDLTITSSHPNQTKVKVNSLKIENFPWTGKYYEGMDTKLKSSVNKGEDLKLQKWESNHHTFSPDNTSKEVVVSLTSIDTVKAFFQFHNDISDLSALAKVDVFPTVITNSFTVEYNLTKASNVEVSLFDISGKMITQLIPITYHNSPGEYSVTLDMSSTNIVGGSYILYFKSDEFHKTTKIVYLK